MATMLSKFRQRFWQPPRAHGEIIEDRTVSFLELFYDLVYVVVIARAAHTLAEHVTWRGVFEFAVIFGLIWIAWLNGTLYYELHGREEGRTRVFVFIQMLLLALLAVFTGDAAGDGGVPFAATYIVFLVVVTWLWYVVRRNDPEEYMATTARYLAGMGLSIVAMAVSIALPDGARVVVWAVVVVAWLAGSILLVKLGADQIATSVTDSMVERHGLFVIIVLGEVVVGVVDGLSEVERDVQSIATGLIGLMIGFAYWWTYFDYVGRRLPRHGLSLARWMMSHLPVTMSIAAVGAAMVSLVEHAGDARAPEATAWLLTGSLALGLLALVITMSALRDFERLPSLYRPVSLSVIAAAGVVLLAGWWRPAPWMLALSLVMVLGAVWWFAVDRWLRLDDPDQIQPNHD